MEAPDTQVLSAMLSPALFMTATGSLLLSANNRLARVVDRLRDLTEIGDGIALAAAGPDRPGVRLHHIRGMIRLQQKRANIILTAITLLYGAFASFVGTSLGIALGVLTNRIPQAIPIALAVLGVTLMLVATFGMLREARLGVRTLKRDVEFHFGLTGVESGPAGRAG